MRALLIASVSAIMIAGCDGSSETDRHRAGAASTADTKAPASKTPPAVVPHDASRTEPTVKPSPNLDALYEQLAAKYVEDAATIRRITANELAELRAKRIEVDEARLLRDFAAIPLRAGSQTRYGPALVAYKVLRMQRAPHEVVIRQLNGTLNPPHPKPKDRRVR